MKLLMKVVYSGLSGFLNLVGRALNQNPTQEELKRVHKVGPQKTPPWKKNRAKTKEAPKATRGRQGKRNKDADYFNHPRKDISSGRQNQ